MKLSLPLFPSFLLLSASTGIEGFCHPTLSASSSSSSSSQLYSSSNAGSNDDEVTTKHSSNTRRDFVVSGISSMIGIQLLSIPQKAEAAIDVSGVRVEGGGASSNPSIASQLKAYDGSGSARVREIQATTTTSPSISKPISPVASEKENPNDPKATWAYRANPGFGPSLTKAGLVGNLYRYNDQVVAPVGSKRRSLNIQFEFPSDWLQLDRNIGGIQYVDQRNGDKLYVLRAPLPSDTQLDTVSKSVIGDMIFDPTGSLIKTGQTVEDYKVSSAQILSQCPNQLCATRRRFKVKYSTVTGNGLSVERRGLVDAYQVENDVYMLMTSSNAVKFDKKDSLERETVENIVNSFQIDA